MKPPTHDPSICRCCWWRKNWRWALPLLPFVIIGMLWDEWIGGYRIYYHEGD